MREVINIFFRKHRTIQNYNGLYRTVWNYIDYTGLYRIYRTIQGKTGLLRTKQKHTELYRGVQRIKSSSRQINQNGGQTYRHTHTHNLWNLQVLTHLKSPTRVFSKNNLGRHNFYTFEHPVFSNNDIPLPSSAGLAW